MKLQQVPVVLGWAHSTSWRMLSRKDTPCSSMRWCCCSYSLRFSCKHTHNLMFFNLCCLYSMRFSCAHTHNFIFLNLCCLYSMCFSCTHTHTHTHNFIFLNLCCLYSLHPPTHTHIWTWLVVRDHPMSVLVLPTCTWIWLVVHDHPMSALVFPTSTWTQLVVTYL